MNKKFLVTFVIFLLLPITGRGNHTCFVDVVPFGITQHENIYHLVVAYQGQQRYQMITLLGELSPTVMETVPVDRRN
ncbi:MAG: hypothetical protein ACOX6Q_02515 [Candidatus Dojkabacteria bacterium]|jgi:hypothetical protein